ncbi:permease [Teredinibacter sp. KSP-S5-2]|uniref:permease n=1 Tax=Teredinibacter sp. KSP-S5-2 TaxID=3034506 RepID=UPI002934441D|nr:permease [Teredinibacter sp. KSP-S5-2]WNO10681.1 permease [Teredinibacter sp. KSP-S5-2]
MFGAIFIRSSEAKAFLIYVLVFALVFFLPLGLQRFDQSLLESLYLAKWYVREHFILCLIPAFIIAGAIGVFINQASIIRHLSSKANKALAYGIASISGSVLAVCSCTVLPLFSGIYRMGAGIGPATTFLYAGPAINILAMVLTFRVLGSEIGFARIIGAVVFSVVIGLIMNMLFGREQRQDMPDIKMVETSNHHAGFVAVHFISMIGILVFANWGDTQNQSTILTAIMEIRWLLVVIFALIFAVLMVVWLKYSWWKIGLAITVLIVTFIFLPIKPEYLFALSLVVFVVVSLQSDDEGRPWMLAAWESAKQVLPMLLIGVLISGFLLGRVGHEGMVPSSWIANLVGGNSFSANFFASVVGALMYFATLTEVPIIQGLMSHGMGQGPALSLLLAGPALSLPNMLVIYQVLGLRKTSVFIFLVVSMATLSGMIFGQFA